MTLRIFIGYDKRQPLAFTVCRSSIERRASKRVLIEPLMLEWMPTKRRGLTDFSFSRYLVPHLCGYEGKAIFLDPDIILTDDIYKILDHHSDDVSVSVVKNKLRFEWASLMVFNNEKCKKLTPELVETGSPQKFDWAESVGELPTEWNHCVGYDAPNADAKLIHFTKGIPCWPETSGSEHASKWVKEANFSTATVSWEELMGSSVHVSEMSNVAAK